MNLAEIKQKGENGGCFQTGDVYWLISQVEKLQSHLATFAMSAPSRERELQRLRDVAEAERDRYKAALEAIANSFPSVNMHGIAVLRGTAREALAKVAP